MVLFFVEEFYVDCWAVEAGGGVNGGGRQFILTVDWLVWVCYELVALGQWPLQLFPHCLA